MRDNTEVLTEFGGIRASTAAIKFSISSALNTSQPSTSYAQVHQAACLIRLNRSKLWHISLSILLTASSALSTKLRFATDALQSSDEQPKLGLTAFSPGPRRQGKII